MSDGLIVSIVQTATRHHLAIENEECGVASVEVVYDRHEYGDKVLLWITVDDPNVTQVQTIVKPS